jgi:O-antigen ligase
VFSRPAVPATHLIGILIFHALFMIFGFAAARDLRAVLLTLLAAAAFYAIVFVRHTILFGDPMRGGFLNDVLGVEVVAIFAAFPQKIGIMVALAALAALGLASSRIGRIIALVTLPLVMLFLFYISARAALLAFVFSLLFWAGAGLWLRSKRLTLFVLIAIVAASALASSLFYERALHERNVEAVESNAVSRTIREIQQPNSGLRLPMWQRTWHQISTEPEHLLFGRGIGMFPVSEGFGAPDWLLRKTEGSKAYPHNIHLEMLYEAGIVGLLLYSIVALFPLAIALTHWHSFSLPERSAVSMYVFHLIVSEFSGAFSYQYQDWFFFALIVGIIALKRIQNVAVPRRGSDNRTEVDRPARFWRGTASATNNPI